MQSLPFSDSTHGLVAPPARHWCHQRLRWMFGTLRHNACIGVYCSGGFQKGELDDAMLVQVSCNRRVIKGGDTGWRLFWGVWKGPLWCVLSKGGITYAFLEQYQLLSTLILCLVWSELTGDGHQAENRKGKLLQWPLNSYYDTLILFSGCFCFGPLCFFRQRREGVSGWKRKKPFFQKGFFLKQNS